MLDKKNKQRKPKISFICYLCEKEMKWKEIKGVITIEDKHSERRTEGYLCSECFYKLFYKFENGLEL
jgi:DNA-directed RNA polymerase subunit RPC12/RpoP